MKVKDIVGNLPSNKVAILNRALLQIFSSVLKQNETEGFSITNGIALPSSAVDAFDVVQSYVNEEVITNDKMRNTFLKSWTQSSDYWEEMVAHIGGVFALGYGSVGTYTFPANVVNGVPQGTKLFIVGVLTRDEVIDRVLVLLGSGAALKQDTIEKIFLVMDLLDYKWSGEEVIKNKEAQIYIADKHKVMPKSGDMFLRFVIYKVSDSTTLIKSSKVIRDIKGNPSKVAGYLEAYYACHKTWKGLSEVFLRHKPLFLAMKNDRTKASINKISKLARKYHRPMPVNPMNNLGYGRITFEDLDKATVFAILRALNYCHNRSASTGDERNLTYKIRNGKIKVVNCSSKKFVNNQYLTANMTTIVSYLQQKLSKALNGVKVYIPSNVKYALPVSEKMMLGGIPFGTRISSDEPLCSGIYWKNEWGATDFDLSGVSPYQRIGWDAKWKGAVQYSGDVTDAPYGAMEFMVAREKLESAVLLVNNRYSGRPGAEYQLCVGKSSDASLSGNGFMMSESKLLFQSPKLASESKEMIVGAFLPNDASGKYEYVVFNLRSSNARVSSSDKLIELKSIMEEYTTQVTLNQVIESMGAVLVDTVSDADIDLTPSSLGVDTLINLFK